MNKLHLCTGRLMRLRPLNLEERVLIYTSPTLSDPAWEGKKQWLVIAKCFHLLKQFLHKNRSGTSKHK